MNPDTFDIEKVTPEYEEDGVTKGRYFYRYHGGIIAHNEVGPSSFRNIYFLNNIDRKSIPLSYFKENAYLIKDGYNPRIDYLKIVDNLIGGIK